MVEEDEHVAPGQLVEEPEPREEVRLVDRHEPASGSSSAYSLGPRDRHPQDAFATALDHDLMVARVVPKARCAIEGERGLVGGKDVERHAV